MADLSQMLIDLETWGWRPVLYVDAAARRAEETWVCYPEAPVRVWHSGRAASPTMAVWSLHAHARAHPNTPPTPPLAAAPAGAERAPIEALTVAAAAPSLARECARLALSLLAVAALYGLALAVAG